VNKLNDLKELAKHKNGFPKREGAVDRLVRILLDQLTPETRKLVVHRFPDDDCWLSLWLARKFVPKIASAEIIFVNAGESLPGTEGDPSVLHFDTGGGEYDQHGKGKKIASAVLLAEKLGLLESEPGLKPLLNLVVTVDNIQPLSPTNIHFAIEGYPRHPDFRNADGTINWQKVQERVFELFDIIYAQETARIRSRENLQKYAEWTTLANGIRVCSLFWHPECREAAFEAGAYVVVWTISRGPNHFYSGIQVNRRYPLFLDGTAAALRSQESKVRGKAVPENLRGIGKIGSWYLHDSKKLLLNGSRSWKPTEEEYTQLAPRQIWGLVCRSLSAIPRETVSRWGER
jgi:hypothetical protein